MTLLRVIPRPARGRSLYARPRAARISRCISQRISHRSSRRTGHLISYRMSPPAKPARDDPLQNSPSGGEGGAMPGRRAAATKEASKGTYNPGATHPPGTRANIQPRPKRFPTPPTPADALRNEPAPKANRKESLHASQARP